MFLAAITASAQDNKRKPHFSPEEFQAKQRAYITEKAELTTEEADAFFPLFFELQKKKFELERNARKDFRKQRGEQMSEEECRAFVYNMADVKIEIAKLEREYTDKYLQVLTPCKVRRVQYAEGSFQRDLMKKMTEYRGNAPRDKQAE
jgi:Spy/CpxP family protein refolding chaperone